jgi:thymidylate synthase
VNIQIASGSSISFAWKDALEKMLSNPGDGISPFLFSIEILDDPMLEDYGISEILDKHLNKKGKPSNKTTANTIFPASYWNPKLPRAELYKRFVNMWPRIKKCRPNRYGHYFQRLIMNEIGISGHSGNYTNQLEIIIDNLNKKNRRRSALQAAIFIPKKDLTNNFQRGFPCLQHVFFTPLDGSALSITGVYATQYLFDRAYGNLFGLHALGNFVAHETNMRLTKIECFVSSLKLGDEITKTYAGRIFSQMEKLA